MRHYFKNNMLLCVLCSPACPFICSARTHSLIHFCCCCVDICDVQTDCADDASMSIRLSLFERRVTYETIRFVWTWLRPISALVPHMTQSDRHRISIPRNGLLKKMLRRKWNFPRNSSARLRSPENAKTATRGKFTNWPLQYKRSNHTRMQ